MSINHSESHDLAVAVTGSVEDESEMRLLGEETLLDGHAGTGAAPSQALPCVVEEDLPEKPAKESAVFLPFSKPTVEDAKALTRKSIRGALRMLQGSWLPLMTDKLHNNMRSRIQTTIVYLFIAALVATLVVLLIWRPRIPSYAIVYSVSPPSTFEFGVPMSPIGVKIYDDFTMTGVSGVKVLLTFSPIAKVGINVTSGRFEGFSHMVECTSNLLFVERKSSDEPVCNVISSQFVATTDHKGIAMFSPTNGNPVIMRYGAPVEYLAVATVAPSSFPALSESYVTSVARASSTVMDSAINADFSWEAIQANGSYFLAAGEERGYNLTATATWRSSNRPETVCGGIIPINLLASVTPVLPSEVPYKSDETTLGTSDIWIRNAIAAAANITQSPTDPTVYSATFKFVNMRINATSTNQMFLGFYFLGRTVPLVITASDSIYQTPTRIIFPYVANTSVATVEVLAPGTLDVQEGAPFPLAVRVSDRAGRPLPDRIVFIRAASAPTNPSVSYGLALLHPGIIPKRLIYNTAMTNSSGIAVLPSIMFSVAGGIGRYDLYAICDGVRGSWGGASTRFNATANVLSSISSFLANDDDVGESDATNVVVVGDQWRVTPTVQIFANTIPGSVAAINVVPVVGKVATIVPVDPLNVSASALSIPSDQQGVIRFDAVTTAFAAYQGHHRFMLIVDGVAVLNFTRFVQFPPNSGHLSGQCAYVQHLQVPVILYTGRKEYYWFRAVDVFGNPVPYATVRAIVPTTLVPPEPGKNISYSTLSMDGSGEWKNFTIVSGNAAAYTLLAQLVCYPSMWGSMTALSSPVALSYAPRVYAMSLVNSGADYSNPNNITSFADIVFEANWEVIDDESPVTVNAEAVWGPESMYLFGSGPKISAVQVAKPGIVRVVCNFSAPQNVMFAGVYLFLITADRTALLPPLFMSVPLGATEVRILRSGWSTDVPIGDPFPTPAVVQVLDANGNPVQGKMLVAQLGVVMANGTINWLSPSTHFEDIAIAALGLTGPVDTMLGNGFPVTRPTDAAGTTDFTGIYIPGTSGGLTLAMRYCVGKNIMFQIFNASDFITGVCAEEAAHVTIPQLMGSSAIVSPLQLSGVPGRNLPPMTITSYVSQRTPANVVVCGFRQVSPPPVYIRRRGLVTYSQETHAPGAVCYAQPMNEDLIECSDTSVMTIADLLYVDERAPDGNYQIEFVCVGAVTQVVNIAVSSVVSYIAPVHVPPPQISLDRTYRFSVAVASVAQIPIAGVSVQLDVSPTNSSCRASECGVLSPAASTFAVTDASGTASFTLAFSASASQSVQQLRASVAPQVSDIAVRQLCRDYATQISYALGCSGEQLSNKVATYGDDVSVGALQVVRNLAVTASVGAYVDTAASSARSSFRGYIAALIEPIIGNRGSSSYLASTPSASTKLTIVNEVGRILVLRQPTFVCKVNSIAIVDQFSGVGYYVPPHDEVPVVRVVTDTQPAQPLANVTVDVTVIPTTPDVTVSLVEAKTDATGTLDMSGMRVFARRVGKYKLLFTIRGAGGVLSQDFEVVAGQLVSTKDALMAAAGLLILILSPVLLASVPHSRSVFLVVSVLMTGGFFAMSVIGIAMESTVMTFFTDSSVVVDIYKWFLFVAAVLLVLSTLAVSIGAMISRHSRVKSFRYFDDESKAHEVFGYTKWLLSVRVDTQLRPADLSLSTRLINTVQGIAGKANDAVDFHRDRLTRHLEQDLLLNRSATVLPLRPRAQGRRRRIQRETRELWYDPSIKDACYVPINFWIVLAILTVVMCILSLFLYYCYREMIDYIEHIIALLPQPDDAMGIEIANHIFLASATAAIDAVVSLQPQYAFLATWLQPLRQVNLVGLLADLVTYLRAAIQILTVCFIVAGILATIAVVVTVVMFALALPKDIRRVRRGQLRITGTASAAEGYIGFHVVLFIMLHQLVFWPVVCVVFVLVVPQIRIFLYDQLKVIVAAAIVSAVVQKIVQVVLVNWFLTDGAFFVVRPEAHSIFHFFELIIGVFSGLAKSITRYAQSIAFVTLLFARIDMSVFPDMFRSLDAATSGYNSLVVMEAKNGNPHFQVFATWLIVEYSLKRFASTPLARRYTVNDVKHEAGELPTLIDIDRFPFSDNVSRCNSGIKNLMALALRMTTCGRFVSLREQLDRTTERYLSLQEYADVSRRERSERIRNRWWLFVLLSKNPSLRKLRKAYLFETDLDHTGIRHDVADWIESDDDEGKEDRSDHSKACDSSV